ncbi:hypothetical protein [Flavobacterium sp.]|uniref:hypothetical protein n=1 Tax=Flavobacterium sp. TaxID=239 RepID=UPI002629809E|nr:hypothetical protein [Flavobacterium sp.]
MKLKYIYSFFLIVFIALHTEAQTYKFLTTGFSVMEKDSKGDWGKWSDLKDTSIVITLDTNKNRIVIYSQEVQLYDILNYEDKEENDNDIIYPFTCKDDDGNPFTISIITRKKQDNRKQLYINQKNFIVVYNIVNYIEKGER